MKTPYNEIEMSKLEDLVKELQSKVSQLEIENAKLLLTLEDNDITEVRQISDVEAICINEIKKLKLISENAILEHDHCKMLDILHANLLKARGLEVDKTSNKKKKTYSANELLSIVNAAGSKI